MVTYNNPSYTIDILYVVMFASQASNPFCNINRLTSNFQIQGPAYNLKYLETF